MHKNVPIDSPTIPHKLTLRDELSGGPGKKYGMDLSEHRKVEQKYREWQAKKQGEKAEREYKARKEAKKKQ